MLSSHACHTFNSPFHQEIVHVPRVFCGVCAPHTNLHVFIGKHDIISQAPLLCATKMAEEMKETKYLVEVMITSKSCAPVSQIFIASLLTFSLSSHLICGPKLQPHRPCPRNNSYTAFCLCP